MTNMNLLWAMGRIDPKLIAAEAPDVPRHRNANKAWVKWTALAACAALLLTAVSIGNFVKKFPETPSHGILPPTTETTAATEPSEDTAREKPEATTANTEKNKPSEGTSAPETEPASTGGNLSLPEPEIISSGMEENGAGGKPTTTYQIAARSVSYCVRGETLTVDLFMGDLYSYAQWLGRDPSYDTYEKNGYPMLRVYEATNDKYWYDGIAKEDSLLLFNGSKVVYEKIFSAEEMKDLDRGFFDDELWCEKPLSEWRRESVEVDLGALKPGDSGEMVFCFGWRYEEHPRGEGFFECFSRVLSYYVGEDVIGFSFAGWEAAREIVNGIEGPFACAAKPIYLYHYTDNREQYDHGSVISKTFRVISAKDCDMYTINISASDDIELISESYLPLDDNFGNFTVKFRLSDQCNLGEIEIEVEACSPDLNDVLRYTRKIYCLYNGAYDYVSLASRDSLACYSEELAEELARLDRAGEEISVLQSVFSHFFYGARLYTVDR